QPRRPQRVREIMPARLKLGRQTTIRDQRSAVRFEEAHKVTLSPDRLPLVPRQRSPTGYPSLALPTPQDSAAIVVRSGDPVQLRAGRRAALGPLGLVVGPHPLFRCRLGLLAGLARDQREPYRPFGPVAGLGGLVSGLVGGLGVAALERAVQQLDRQQQC